MNVISPNGIAAIERAEFYQACFEARLKHCHGPERAAAILAGTDPATKADLAAWNALGKPKGAAA